MPVLCLLHLRKENVSADLSTLVTSVENFHGDVVSWCQKSINQLKTHQDPVNRSSSHCSSILCNNLFVLLFRSVFPRSVLSPTLFAFRAVVIPSRTHRTVRPAGSPVRQLPIRHHSTPRRRSCCCLIAMETGAEGTVAAA